MLALDMETAAVAKVCGERGVAWSVVRAISDRAGDGTVDAEIFGLSHADGSRTCRPSPATSSGIPARLPRLLRLAQRMPTSQPNGRPIAARSKFLTDSR